MGRRVKRHWRGWRGDLGVTAPVDHLLACCRQRCFLGRCVTPKQRDPYARHAYSMPCTPRLDNSATSQGADVPDVAREHHCATPATLPDASYLWLQRNMVPRRGKRLLKRHCRTRTRCAGEARMRRGRNRTRNRACLATRGSRIGVARASKWPEHEYRRVVTAGRRSCGYSYTIKRSPPACPVFGITAWQVPTRRTLRHCACCSRPSVGISCAGAPISRHLSTYHDRVLYSRERQQREPYRYRVRNATSCAFEHQRRLQKPVAVRSTRTYIVGRNGTFVCCCDMDARVSLFKRVRGGQSRRTRCLPRRSLPQRGIIKHFPATANLSPPCAFKTRRAVTTLKIRANLPGSFCNVMNSLPLYHCDARWHHHHLGSVILYLFSKTAAACRGRT